MFKASFPGGSYVSSSTANFPAATSIAGAVIELKPGGLREPHWHDTVEWAYVLAGTCRWDTRPSFILILHLGRRKKGV